MTDKDFPARAQREFPLPSTEVAAAGGGAVPRRVPAIPQVLLPLGLMGLHGVVPSIGILIAWTDRRQVNANMTKEREVGTVKPGGDELVSATLLSGGLRTIRCSLVMVLEQARYLQSLGLVAEKEVGRLDGLAVQFEDLMQDFHRGEFLGDLQRLLADLRKGQVARAQSLPLDS